MLLALYSTVMGHSQAPWVPDLSIQLNLLKGLINNHQAPEQMEVVLKGTPSEGWAHCFLVRSH